MNEAALAHEALIWWQRGLSPVPLVYGDKTPVKGVKWSKLWHHRAARELVNYWFSAVPGYRGLGVVLLGQWVVIDFDEPGSYEAWGNKIRTLTHTTGRGHHAWFNVEEPPLATGPHQYGGEVLCGRHLINVPPTMHSSGVQYTKLIDAPIATIQSIEDIGIEIIKKKPKDDDAPAPISSSSGVVIPVDYESDHSIIEQLKATIPVQDVLTSFGVQMRGGACCCPFHEDRTPSMLAHGAHAKCMNPQCVASEAMDVVDLTKMLYGCDTKEAIKRLR